MKCKTFETRSITTLEHEINNWLEQNKSIQLQESKYCHIYDNKFNTQYYSCVIFYKELKELRKDKLIELKNE